MRDCYFTFSFFPARILLLFMPLSFLSFSTVVPFLRAMVESDSPFLMVTSCDPRLLRLRLDEVE